MSKLWPFPGDAPVTRARKMALAYQNLAKEQAKAIELLIKLRDNLNGRTAARDAVDDMITHLSTFDNVDQMDQRFRDWGEDWHVPLPDHYDEDDMVPSKIAATLVPMSRKHISTLRIHGRIKGKWDENLGPYGGYRYRVGDLYKLATDVRTRSSRKGSSADSIADNRRSDSE